MKLIDVDEAAEVLGVGRARVYDLVRDGVLPCVRLRRQVRIDEEALRSWIAAGGCALEETRASADGNRR